MEEPGEVANTESHNVLSIQEVAKLLNVPVSTIYAWKRRGEGPPYYKIGRKLRYRKSDARKWLAEHLVSRTVCQSGCGPMLETPFRCCRVSDRPLRSTYAGAVVVSEPGLPAH